MAGLLVSKRRFGRMWLRVVLLSSVLLFAALPVRAQGNGGGNGGPPNQNSLVAQLNALTARVAKLEGNITSADLAGTYTLAGIQTRLRGGGAANAAIGSAALTGSLILAADGTGSLTINGDGSLLFPLAWTSAQSTLGNGNPGETFDLTWTFANGEISTTVTTGEGTSSGPPINVGLGGRLLVATLSEFRGDPKSNDLSLLIFYRLQ
jgi:hypothetical protein